MKTKITLRKIAKIKESVVCSPCSPIFVLDKNHGENQSFALNSSRVLK